jgi:hypothetical protein
MVRSPVSIVLLGCTLMMDLGHALLVPQGDLVSTLGPAIVKIVSLEVIVHLVNKLFVNCVIWESSLLKMACPFALLAPLGSLLTSRVLEIVFLVLLAFMVTKVPPLHARLVQEGHFHINLL